MLPPRPIEPRGTNPSGRSLPKRLRGLFARRIVPRRLVDAWYYFDVTRTHGAARARAGSGIVAVVTYRGSPGQLNRFLEHHRRIGIEEYVFLDLSKAGDLAGRLENEPSCSVWRPRRPWSERQALAWQNYLRDCYAEGRWCLSLESTDLFVFYRYESRPILSLVDFLETEYRDHLYAVVVHLYGERPAEEIALAQEPKLPDQAFLFDSIGYVTFDVGSDRSVTIRGGLLRRALFGRVPHESPPLNRIPLIKWRRTFSYLDGHRLLWPHRLNTPHARWHTSPTGCLLRLSVFMTEGSEDDLCLPPCAEPLRRRALRNDVSQRYKGSEDLVNAGLLNPGQWF
jgi:hypothetical protein